MKYIAPDTNTRKTLVHYVGKIDYHTCCIVTLFNLQCNLNDKMIILITDVEFARSVCVWVLSSTLYRFPGYRLPYDFDRESFSVNYSHNVVQS